MKAPRNATKRPKASARKEAPLTPDALLLRENGAPSAPVPKKIAQHLAIKSAIVSASGAQLEVERCVTRVEGEKSAWRITLPDNAGFGLPVRSAARFAPGHLSKKYAAPTHTEAFRSHWVSQIFHPKLTTAPRPRLLRSSSGRRVIPYGGIYGNDDRQVIYPFGYPWQCIGRVFSYRGNQLMETGTGVLVGPRHVLTAGHLVPWPEWLLPVGGSMQFVPAYYDGSSVAGPGATSWVTDGQGWDTAAAAYDMAVLRLAEPLGDWLGWFGSKIYDDDWEDETIWTMVGYPGDVAMAERPSFQIGISILDDDSDGDALELENHGDASPGDSGGPLFSIWPDGFPYVIGTTVGNEILSGGFLGIGDEDNNVAAGGKAMVDLINWARGAWP
jgi:V8-like Glu-specific endopeptidase